MIVLFGSIKFDIVTSFKFASSWAWVSRKALLPWRVRVFNKDVLNFESSIDRGRLRSVSVSVVKS